MRRFICTLFSAILLVIGTSAKAKNDNPFDITFYGSFLHTETVPNALFFFKEIKQYDSFELRRALRTHEIDTVVLASPGGSVWEGLNMAGIIHDKGIKTYIPELDGDFGCYSACSFMFFGGQIRKVDGLLAVHQMSSRSDQAAQINKIEDDTQYTVSEIIGFLNEFETPPWVYERMFRSTEFYIFDEDESNRLAARSDEIKLDNIYKINAFISSYLKYLADSVVDKSDDNTAATLESDKEEAEDLRQLVVEIQKLLNAVGCNAGVIDGIWGHKTQAAAVLFAKTAKLPTSDDNLISAQFVKRLRAAPNNFCPKQKVKPKAKTITSKSKIIEPFAPGRYLAFSTCELGSKIGTESHVTLIKKSSAWEKYSVQFFHRSSKLGTATIQVSTGFKGFTMKLNKGVSSKLFQFETFRTGYHVAKERNGCKFHLNMAKAD